MVLNVDTIKCLKVVKNDRTAIKREKKLQYDIKLNDENKITSREALMVMYTNSNKSYTL